MTVRPYADADAEQLSEILTEQFAYLDQQHPGAMPQGIAREWTAEQVRAIMPRMLAYVDDRRGTLYSAIIGLIQERNGQPWYVIKFAPTRITKIEIADKERHLEYCMAAVLDEATKRGAVGTHLIIPKALTSLAAFLDTFTLARRTSIDGVLFDAWSYEIPVRGDLSEIKDRTRTEPRVKG